MLTTGGARPRDLDQALVDTALLLVGRVRRQLEHAASEQQWAEPDAADVEELARARQLEARLKLLQEQVRAGGVPAAPAGRQPSRYYEVPGQEDA
jgi:hypothetical protein